MSRFKPQFTSYSYSDWGEPFSKNTIRKKNYRLLKEELKNELLKGECAYCIVIRSKRGEWGEWFEKWENKGNKIVKLKEGWM
jgi:hypothetical protein